MPCTKCWSSGRGGGALASDWCPAPNAGAAARGGGPSKKEEHALLWQSIQCRSLPPSMGRWPAPVEDCGASCRPPMSQGPEGAKRREAQPAGEAEKQRSVPFSVHSEIVKTKCSCFEWQLILDLFATSVQHATPLLRDPTRVQQGALGQSTLSTVTDGMLMRGLSDGALAPNKVCTLWYCLRRSLYALALH